MFADKAMAPYCYGLYSCGVYSYGPHSYGCTPTRYMFADLVMAPYSHCLCIYGLCGYGSIPSRYMFADLVEQYEHGRPIQLYIGIADGMSIVRVLACPYSK